MSQINQSSNSLAKQNISKGSGTPAADRPTKSSNSTADFTITRGSLAFEGDDLTDANPPGDMMSGIAPGIGELGGFSHFKGRTLPSITH